MIGFDILGICRACVLILMCRSDVQQFPGWEGEAKAKKKKNNNNNNHPNPPSKLMSWSRRCDPGCHLSRISTSRTFPTQQAATATEAVWGGSRGADLLGATSREELKREGQPMTMHSKNARLQNQRTPSTRSRRTRRTRCCKSADALKRDAIGTLKKRGREARTHKV